MSTSGKSAGSVIQLSDLQDWYTTFNNFANSYGTSSMAISMSNTTQPTATDYNKLANIVSTYQTDEYLKTVTWPSASTVSAGSTLTIATANDTSTGIVAINNVQKTIKCRNSIAYSNGNHSNGTGNSHGSACNESYYNEGHVSLSNTYYNCCQARYYYCSQRTYTHSNTAKSNGTKIDITNSNKSA